MNKIKCLRCGQEFEPPGDKTNICGNCADDLRAEQDALNAQAEAETEARAYAEWTEEQYAEWEAEQRGGY